MANGIEAVQRGKLPQHRGSPSMASSRAAKQGLGWLPVALGTAVVAGLGRRSRVILPLALTAVAGTAAVAAFRGLQLGRGEADSKAQPRAGDRKPEVEHSITIGSTADELRRRWLDQHTLQQLMEGFATVRPAGDGRLHWRVEGPLGRTYEWESATTHDQPGDSITWRSLPNAAVSTEGSVRFRPAPPGRGTVVTLHLRFDPPGGALGDAALALLGTTPLKLAADAALRRFKSLVETGEIPTTERQPAARADTR